MKKTMAFFSLAGILIFSDPASAQLNSVFNKIITKILVTDFQRSVSPGEHGDHFIPAAQQAFAKLTPALNTIITSNIASFPLSSTVASGNFDFSSGRPILITESLGPIFAETAQTLGKRRASLGFNYTRLNISKFRGLSMDDIRFTFTHEEIDPPSALGSNRTERDLVDLFLDLDLSANIFALSGTYGVSDNFDIGVAIPIISVGLQVNARAVVNSYTATTSLGAIHRFDNGAPTPDLEDTDFQEENATNVGDIALRFKYGLQRSAGVDMAALLDLRLPTGKKEDFLGTGKLNARLSWIMSKKIGDFTPHLNLGYSRRSADFDSDQLELTLGFDRKLASGFTVAAELFGGFALSKDETIQLLPGSTPVTFTDAGATPAVVRQIDLSNVPERDRDNVLNAAVGFRAAPSERFSLLGNIIIALNDGGLRSSVIPTLGANLSF